MGDTPWIKFYASDWLAGTGGLTAAERGVYITLIALIYESGGRIPHDRARLARRCGVPAGSFKRILDSLIAERKIIEVPEGLTNGRAEAEIGEREKLRTKHQSGARKTNTILAEKKQQNQGSEKRTAQRTANAYQKPEPDRDTNVSQRAMRASESEAEFEAFWDLVPRKAGKGSARTAYAQARRKASAEEIAAGMSRHAREVAGKEVRFIPHPSTWLNGERWADQAASAQSHSQQGNRTGPRPHWETMRARLDDGTGKQRGTG